MLKAVRSTSIRRIIDLWSLTTIFLAVYFLAVSGLALMHTRDSLERIAEARRCQRLVQQLQLALESDREQTARLLATGEVELALIPPDYETMLATLVPVVTSEDAADLRKEVGQERSRLALLVSKALHGQLAEARAELARPSDTDSLELDGHLEGLLTYFEGQIDEQRLRQRAFEPYLVFFMGVGVCLGVALGWQVRVQLSNRMKPLAECSALAVRMGEGDFSSSSLPLARYRDEVGTVTEVLGGCFRRLRDLSHKGQLLALEVGTLSRRLLETSRQQTALSGAESQLAQEAGQGVEELARGASQMVAQSQEVIHRARVTEAGARFGLQAVQDTVRSVGTTLEQLQAVGDIAVALSENTRIIGDVVNMINDISDRSNIVAINASILAAASGVEAKSFAVVAREMKTLADQSKDASAGVRGILKNIERGIQTCAHLTEEAVNQGKATGASTDDSDITIRRLAENIKNSLQAFQETVVLTQGQQETCARVAQSLSRLQSSCSESARGARELEATAEEMSQVANRLVSLMSIYKQAPDRPSGQ